MANTPEALVKKKVKAILQEVGAYIVMSVPTGYGQRGVPDFVCCVYGFFLAIETKAAGGKPTRLQEIALENIKQAEGVAVVINEYNIDMVKDICQALKLRRQSLTLMSQQQDDLK